MNRSKLRVTAYAVCALYAVLLVASYLVWSAQSIVEPELEAYESRVVVQEVEGRELGPARVELTYRELGQHPKGPVLVLLHGSPGSSHDFAKLERELSRSARLIIPDLPGFGKSERVVPDYSIEAHALYVKQLLEHLRIERAHLVGFSMGGGVALELADIAPERVASISMIAAIGVQEYELFGDYDLNHNVHRVLLAAVQAFRYGFPHFGAYDELPINYAFARNFIDSDQRPLRSILRNYNSPMLIVHGEADVLVPLDAALEHHRLVPQSELALLDANHFLPWMHAAELTKTLSDFLARVEAGEARTRARASAERVEAATTRFDPTSIPPLSGSALILAMLLIAAATLLTEDLTCILVGLVIAQGRIGYVPGTFACFCGIFFGDVLLYLMGRFIGRAAMGRRPLRWWLTPSRIDRASVWFRTKGMQVIFVSRFLPGFRVPTYFAAGVLKTHFFRFACYFAIAVALWTPVLVGLSMWAGREIAGSLESLGAWALPALAALALAIYFVQSIALPMFSHRGRRLLVGRFRRKLRWEFWPPLIFYAPLAVYILWLAIRHRSLTLFAAANPGIPTGGFIGESKLDILEQLGPNAPLPKAVLIPGHTDGTRLAEDFLSELDSPFPIVLKPNTGQRGSGVLVLADRAALQNALEVAPFDRLLQEHVGGQEFGIFWIHVPGEPSGRIFSITTKELPVLLGDGVRTIEELILDDPRAVCMASTYLDANAERIMEVPEPGKPIQLVDLGTHCLGAIFKNGCDLITPELTARVAEIAGCFEGFWFGRFDVRVPSETHLKAGKQLAILELNGVTSEATHIYDERTSLREAYRVLFEQWRLAYEIGRRNVEAGSATTSCRELFAAYRDYRRQQSGHVAAKKSLVRA